MVLVPFIGHNQLDPPSMDSLLEELSKSAGQGHEAFGSGPPATGKEPAGTADPGVSHWLTHTSPDECFARAASVVPRALQLLTLEAARRWDMRAEPILATLLHVLSGLAGTRHRLRRAHLGFSCPFNLVVCGDARSRQNWMEYLAEPWLGPIRTRIRTNQAFGAAHFLEELKGLEKTSSLAYGSLFDKEKLALRAKLNLAPCALERSPLPGNLLDALKYSYLRSVVSLNSGVDPMSELIAKGKKTATELCRILEMAWRDMDLPSKGPIPRRGIIHLLWRTEATAARQVVHGAGSSWNALCPPVLLMREGPQPAYLTPLEAEIYAGWTGLCSELTRSLESMRDAVVWSLSPEADKMAAAFCCEVAAVSPHLAPLSSHHFSWLHELVIRLGMLFSILESLGTTSPTDDFIVGVENMERACAVGRWLAQEHLECLTWLRLPTPIGSAFDDQAGIDNIDIEQLRTAILERLASKGPMARRELSRSFHEMPAQTRDFAISSLKKAGLAVETTGGKVACAQGTRSNPATC